MKTITNKTYSYLEIKNSKFHTILAPIENIDDFNNLLNEVKAKYPKASHYCYSYILDKNTYKFFDDKEPKNSAGRPIYNALNKNKLNFIACIVIRYYGGTPLGKGGLVRSYSNSAILALEKSNIITLEDGYIIEVKYSTSDSHLVQSKFSQNIIDTKYIDNFVIFKLHIKKKDLSFFNEYQILENKPIKKD